MGHNNKTGFGFADACSCLLEAFAYAQKRVLAAFHGKSAPYAECWLPEPIFGDGSSDWKFARVEE